MSNEVRLSKETLDTLKSLYAINQTLKIVQGVKTLRTINENYTAAVYAEIDEEFPRNFYIYDLREFIAVHSIIENPVLDFTNPKYVVVRSEDGTQRLRYMDGAENLINSYFERDFKLPSEDITVNVTEKQLAAVMGAATALKLAYVGFRADGKKIMLTAFDRNNGDGAETNGFSIEVGETTATFEMFYRTESLTVLNGDCTFAISKNKISRVENARKVFWLTLDANSTFG